jgi:hypothetical protein
MKGGSKRLKVFPDRDNLVQPFGKAPRIIYYIYYIILYIYIPNKENVIIIYIVYIYDYVYIYIYAQ